MTRRPKNPMLILAAVLIVSSIIILLHHAAIHSGAIYDESNLYSHEAVVVGFGGMAVGILITLKTRIKGRGRV